MTVRWSHSAQDDLDQIYSFIAEESPDAAARLQDQFLKAGENLSRFSGRGRQGRIAETRELVIVKTPYLLIYAEDADATVILRVIHGAQLWPPTDGA